MHYYRELQLIKKGQCPVCSRSMIIGEDSQYLCKGCDISVAIPEKKPISQFKVWCGVFVFCLIVWSFVCFAATEVIRDAGTLPFGW